MTRRRYSPVKVTKADGTVEVQPAYGRREVSSIKHHGERAAEKGVTRATAEQSCSSCGEPITIGMQMVGFINPPAAHHWPQCRQAVYAERRRRRS